MKIYLWIRPGYVPENKKYSITKSSHKTVTFHLPGEKPPLAEQIQMKICTNVHLGDGPQVQIGKI